MTHINLLLRLARSHGMLDKPIAHDFQTNSFGLDLFKSKSNAAVQLSKCGKPSVYGSECIEVLGTENFFEKGYKIQKENVALGFLGDNPIEMEVAYTYNNDYIGSRKTAEMLASYNIVPELASPNHKVCSIGRSSDGKYYGWSHRAIFGFPLGYEVTDVPTPFTLDTEDAQKAHAIKFAESVSSSPITQDDEESMRSYSAARKDPVGFAELAWYRFKGKQAKTFPKTDVVKDGVNYEIYIQPEETFGVIYDDTIDAMYLMDADTEVVWTLPKDVVAKFLKRCTGFGGKINKTPVYKGNGTFDQIVMTSGTKKKKATKTKVATKDLELDLDNLDLADIMEEHPDSFTPAAIVKARKAQDLLDAEEDIMDADSLEEDMDGDFEDDEIILDGGDNTDGFDYSKRKKRKTKQDKMQDFLGEPEYEDTDDLIDDDLMDEDVSPNKKAKTKSVQRKDEVVYGFSLVSHNTDTLLVGFGEDKEQVIDDMDAVSRMSTSIGNSGIVYTVPKTNNIYRKFLGRKKQNNLFLEIPSLHAKALSRDAIEAEQVSLRPDIKHEDGHIEQPVTFPKSYRMKTLLHPSNRIAVYREVMNLINKHGYFTKSYSVPEVEPGNNPAFRGIRNRAATAERVTNLSKVQDSYGKTAKISNVLARLPYLELVGNFDSHKVIVEGRNTLRRVHQAFGNIFTGFVAYDSVKGKPVVRLYLRPASTKTEKGKAAFNRAKNMLRDIKSGELVVNRTVHTVPGLGQGVLVGYNMWDGTVQVKATFKNPDKTLKLNPSVKRDPSIYGVYIVEYSPGITVQ